jgi:hypothetical protein
MIFNCRPRAAQGYVKVSSWWPIRLTASSLCTGLLRSEVHSGPRGAAIAAHAEVSGAS